MKQLIITFSGVAPITSLVQLRMYAELHDINPFLKIHYICSKSFYTVPKCDFGNSKTEHPYSFSVPSCVPRPLLQRFTNY